jgi:hypothetical protein
LDTGLNIKLHFVICQFIDVTLCIYIAALYFQFTKRCGVEFSIAPSYSGGAGLESEWQYLPGKYCDILGSRPQPLLFISQFI